MAQPRPQAMPERRDHTARHTGGRIRANAPAAAALVLFLLLGLASCFAPSGFVPIEDPDAVWNDDGTPQSLEQAIERSIAYYRRLPPGAAIPFGELTYSPREMIRSHRLFLELRRTVTDPEAFARLLLERFHLLESFAADGDNLFTGYFEPIIAGSLRPQPGMETPIYSLPDDLVKIDLSRFGGDMPRQTLVGRLKNRLVLPYYSRKEIQERDVLKGVARPFAYVNEIDLFFLQIQGSGLVRFLDGTELRVNYAAANGHPYRSIGAALIRREILTREEVTMQSIREFLNANPDAVRPLLYSNPSYTFFREVERGPLGNIEVPLTPGRSLALDHRLFPKGGLAYIETETTLFGDAVTRPLTRFMLVQDTGGAIRGHGRADVFWGKGMEAEWAAGNMKFPGRLVLLAAKKAYLQQSPRAAAATPGAAPRVAGDRPASPQ